MSAEARSRPIVLAGLGPDATHGWEVGSGGLESTKRVWLPEFIARLRSVFIPLPRPEWIAAQAAQQGTEVAAPGAAVAVLLRRRFGMRSLRSICLLRRGGYLSGSRGGRGTDRSFQSVVQSGREDRGLRGLVLLIRCCEAAPRVRVA